MSKQEYDKDRIFKEWVEYMSHIEREYLGHNIQKYVYHYTSPFALFSIFTNGTLRLSDYRFLNDRDEVKILPRLMIEEIENRNMCSKSFELVKLICKDVLAFNIRQDTEEERLWEWAKVQDNLLKNKSTEEGWDDDRYNQEFDKISLEQAMRFSRCVESSRYCYILSCTSNSDKLPMWNYYCKTQDKTGYNIEIDSLELFKYMDINFSHANVLCGNVIYDLDIQREIVNSLIDYILEYESKSTGYGEFGALGGMIRKFIFNMAPFMKTSDFKHEKEFRYVISFGYDAQKNVLNTTNPNYGSTDLNNIEMEYFINGGIFVPQIEIKLDDLGRYINNITIGPYRNDLHEIGLYELLKKRDLNTKVGIKLSTIEVRN